MQKTMISMRDNLEFCKERGELLITEEEVDPIYEIAAIQKALEGGPGVLFQNIRGYPNVRYLGNVFSSEQRTAAIMGESEYRNLKFRCIDALKNLMPPEIVNQAPCQEIVITENIDIPATLPILKHSEADGAHVLGGGMLLTSALSNTEGSSLSLKRVHFRGKNWGSVHIFRNTHLDYVQNTEHKGEKIPVTINIGVPPAVTIIAAGFTIKAVVPYGMDELALAGAFQGSPVEICRAKTVECYAIASSEWVIEGYLTPERIWETDEAEKAGQLRKAPLFPEWHGYMGMAALDSKFEVTALTHRKDNPIYTSYLPPSYEAENILHPLTEACFCELTKSIAPNLVRDVNILHGFRQIGGIVIQVKKTNIWDDGSVRNILLAALAVPKYAIAIAVDEDVDIYNADEVLWAIWTRGNREGAIFRAMTDCLVPGSLGATPSTGKAFKRGGISDGGLAIDATLPLEVKEQYRRARYPVDKIDLCKWFSDAELASARRMQPEYARSLAKSGG